MEDFTTFWTENEKKILRRCARIVGIEDAHDLLMEVWFKCKDRDPDEIENWWNYVSRVCYTTKFDWDKQKEKEDAVRRIHQEIYSNPDYSTRQQIALLFSSKVLDKTEECILEMYMDNRTQAEMAVELNLSLRTINRKYQEAIAKSSLFFKRLKRK